MPGIIFYLATKTLIELLELLKDQTPKAWKGRITSLSASGAALAKEYGLSIQELATLIWKVYKYKKDNPDANPEDIADALSVSATVANFQNNCL
jgi:hypothetical protein